MAPFAPSFLPAAFSPTQAPNSLPIIRPNSFLPSGLDAPDVAMFRDRTLGFATNSWLGNSASRWSSAQFSAVLRDWHAPRSEERRVGKECRCRWSTWYDE